MMDKMRGPDADYLFKAILSLNTLEECYAFFEDLCTYNELLAMRQRFSVASLLSLGETQVEIKEKTGASSATISRVNRAFRHGNDAYKMVFARIGQSEV